MVLSIYGYVSRGICTEGAQMCQFNMVTHLENWSHWECGGVMQFFCSTLIDSAILLHDNVQLHTAQQTM